MRIRFAAGMLTCGVLSLNAAMIPGEPAPDLVVRNVSGASVKLSSYQEKKYAVLVGLPPDRVAAINWSEAERRLASLETVLLFNSGGAGTVLIDRTGVVRRVLAGHTLTTAAGIMDFVEVWQSGKGAFVAYCARCHGENGDAIWCDPKPLTGLGQRMSPEQVRETLRMTEVNDDVLIRGERVKRVDIEPIIVYIRSL